MNTETKERFHLKPKHKESLFILSLVIIPLLNFAVFWVYVNIDTILLTFQTWDYQTASYKWYGIKRYVEVFTQYFSNTETYKAEFNTFINSFHAILINIIILPLAFIAAYGFYKKMPLEKFYRVTFYIPSLMSITALAMLFRYMFNADFGPLNKLFEAFGVSIEWLGPESPAMWSLIYIFCIWSGLGVNVIMMNSAMQRIPGDIAEYSKLEGVGFFREAFQIVLPLVMPTVGIYIISVFASVFTFTLQPMLLAVTPGVDNRFLTIGWYIFRSVEGGNEQTMLHAATLGISFTIIMLPIIILVRLIVNKLTPDVQF